MRLKTQTYFSLRYLLARSFLLLTLLTCLTLSRSPVSAANPEESQMGFTENRGQIMDDEGKPVPDVYYQAGFPGMQLFVTREGLTCVFFQREEDEDHESEQSPEGEFSFDLPEKVKTSRWRMDIRLVGGSIRPELITGVKQIPGHQNYFLPDATDGIYNVKSYERLRIANVYPGIDWTLFRDESGQFKHEFEVAPGVSPDIIQLQYLGAEINIDFNGKRLLVQTPLGELEEGDLVCRLLESDREVEARFQQEEDRISYDFEPYDEEETLIVDPSFHLTWATRYGGNDIDGPRDMAIDQQGNVYIVGYTESTNFPMFNPGGGAYFDPTPSPNFGIAFITKFSSSGVRLWATYHWRFHIRDVVVDPGNNVYVVGAALNGFSTQNPGGGAYFDSNFNNGGWISGFDGGLVKFDPNGVRLWATLIGGTNGDDISNIAFNSIGEFYITGSTNSTDFPLVNPGNGAFFDNTIDSLSEVFLARFNTSGALIWSTLYGGSNYEFGMVLDFDSQGNVFLSGATRSTNFPCFNPGGGEYFLNVWPGGWEKTFALRFNPNNQLTWGTLIGGSSTDFLTGMLIDPQDNVFFSFEAPSTDMPTLNPGGGAYFQSANAGLDDIFLFKLNSSLQQVWGTYFGGSGWERSRFYYSQHLAMDQDRNLYLLGFTNSNDLPVSPVQSCGIRFYQGNLGSSPYTMFLTCFNSSGSMEWSTHYGSGTMPSTLVIDSNEDLYITGEYYTPNFPNAYGPYVDQGGGAWFQTTGAGSDDAMILKLSNCKVLPLEWQSFSADLATPTSVMLDWEVLTEQQTSHFVVERSADLSVFTSLGQVEAGENTGTVLPYQYEDQLDASITSPILYYRLRAVDANGDSDFSSVATLSLTAASEWISRISPNPASDRISFRYLPGHKTSADLRVVLVNAMGQEVLQHEFEAVDSGSTLSIPVAGLATGIYTVEFRSQQLRYVQRIQLMR